MASSNPSIPKQSQDILARIETAIDVGPLEGTADAHSLLYVHAQLNGDFYKRPEIYQTPSDYKMLVERANEILKPYEKGAVA